MNDESNNFPMTQQQPTAMVAVQQTRAQSEIQGMMTVAKRFPRDQMASFNRIMKACQRKTLAEQAMYAYPRGGQTVTGESIRLAEVLAQNWGNLDFGIIEVEQRDGESTMMAYCLDLETNVRQQKTFIVKHERDTKQGRKTLTDNRDIYEMTANQGARRLRACILGVIPGDITDAAREECEKTLRGQTKEPIADRVRVMATTFDQLGVTQEMLEARLQHKLDVCIEAELVTLRKIYTSIKDGFTKREEWFTISGAKPDETGGEVEKLKQKVAKKSETEAAPEEKKPVKNYAPQTSQNKSAEQE